MKLKSIKDLYLVKQMVLKCPDKEYSHKVVEIVNGVLLREGGSKVVLYPYNNLRETILELFGQCMSPKDIATKLGLGEDGEEVVLCVVEEPQEDSKC